MKQKFLLPVILIVAAIGVYWYFGMKEPGQTQQEQSKNQQPTKQIQQSQETPEDETTKVEEVPNALEGELKISNDKKRGNYMLLLNDSDRIIYLNTGRDYSDLVGKQVSVAIEGSLDDFRLVDIKVK